MFNHIEVQIPKLERVTLPDGKRTYVTPSGKSYPSVTTVTGLLAKESIINWRNKIGHEEAKKITTRASRRGTSLHLLCEKYLNNEEPSPSYIELEMWKSVVPELHNINNIRCLETGLYSDHLEVAGTVDCIGEYKGKLAVIDFKSSGKVKKKEWISNYFMQCAAYSVAFEELTGIPVPRLVVIMGVDENPVQVFEEKRDTWIDEFIKLRAEYKKQFNI